MTAETLLEVVNKLSLASQRDLGLASDTITWPHELEKDQWFMSPELISIYGTDAYDQLSDESQKQLSFYECVNLFSMNVNGERLLMEGLARRLYKPITTSIAPYLHHFLDEENKHMSFFGGFCLRYANKIYAGKHVAFDRDYARGEEDFLFFAKVLIFEEVIDAYNRRIMVDERVNSLARKINWLHHKDEARHLVFGRSVVLHLFQLFASEWSDNELARVRENLTCYLLALFREFFNPEVYRDSGLKDQYQLATSSFEKNSCRTRRQTMVGACVNFLLRNHILEEGICL